MRFGPGNRIFDVQDAALTVATGSVVEITQNQIGRNNQGIVFAGTAPVAAPTIVNVSTSSVEGTCPSAGRVEVFADSGNQGSVFLGQIDCDGVTPWTLAVAAPTGMNVTATLTTAGSTSTFSAPVAVP